MKQVSAPQTLEEFARVFDNGGRLWNVFSRKGDGVLSAAELARAAGTLSADAESLLHFEFLRGFLNDADHGRAVEMLEPELREWRAARLPAATSPSRLESDVPAERTAILTGIPVLMKNPKLVGGEAEAYIRKDYLYTMVEGPLYAHHELYEVYDASPGKGASAILAVPVQDGRLPGARLHLAGVVRDILPESSRQGPWKRYLLGLFFSPA